MPALMVLDLMLPEIDGLEVCKLLRRDPPTARIPILMLTAKAAEIDRVLGLELGADDYVTKPFSPRELVLRVKKILERGRQKTEARESMRFGDLLIDVPQHLATLEGQGVRPDRHRIQAADGARATRRAACNRATPCCGMCGNTTPSLTPARWTRTCGGCAKSSARRRSIWIPCAASVIVLSSDTSTHNIPVLGHARIFIHAGLH